MARRWTNPSVNEMNRDTLSTASCDKMGASTKQEIEMPRKKSPVLRPLWVDPVAHAQRAAKLPHDMRPAPPVPRPVLAPTKPILVATNAAPIDKGLIGYERPKLATSNGHALLPDNDYRMS